MFVMIS